MVKLITQLYYEVDVNAHEAFTITVYGSSYENNIVTGICSLFSIVKTKNVLKITCLKSFSTRVVVALRACPPVCDNLIPFIVFICNTTIKVLWIVSQKGRKCNKGLTACVYFALR